MEIDLQPYRDLLQGCFEGFLDLVEPGWRERDRLQTVAFLDDGGLDGWPEAERRRVGLVADVRGAGGKRWTVLVQIEPRPGDRAVLEERLLRYYLWLLVGRRRPVRLIVVVVEGGEPGIREEAIVERHGDVEVMRIPYRVVGLESCRSSAGSWAGRIMEERQRSNRP